MRWYMLDWFKRTFHPARNDTWGLVWGITGLIALIFNAYILMGMCLLFSAEASIKHHIDMLREELLDDD